MAQAQLVLGDPLAVPDPPFWVATQTLRDWIAQAANIGAPAEPDTFADLHPLGRHWLVGARAATVAARRVAVLELDLALIDGRRTGYLPAPLAAVRAALAEPTDRDATVWLHGLGADGPPDWAGSPGLVRVRAGVTDVALSMSLLADGRVALPAHTSPEMTAQVEQALGAANAVMSVLAERHLRHATPLVVAPELLAGLPSFDDAEEAFRYGAMVELPFQSVWLDTSGDDGRGALVELTTARDLAVEFRLFGGLVWPERGGVSVTPFGWPADTPNPDGRPEMYGRVLFGTDSGGRSLLPTWQTTVSDPRTGLAAKLLTVPPLGALLLQAAAGMPGRDTFEDLLLTAPNLPGEVQLGGGGAPGRFAGSDDPNAFDPPALARAVLQLACELLGVFYFLDIDGVTLAPVTLPRAQRRQAQRDRRPLAQTAVIQPALAPNDQATAPPRNGDAADDPGRYSHRFFVRGHYKHHRPGGRVADARPDLIRPCPKPGCGSCRRIPVAGHWKGPEGAPVKLRARVLKPRAGQAPATDPPAA